MHSQNTEIRNLLQRFLNRKDADERPQCATSYSVDHSGSVSTLRMKCEGCSHGSSLSNETCRREVMAKLLSDPVEKLEFVRRLTTEEYEKEDIEALREIAKATLDLGGSSFGIFTSQCGECAEKVRSLRDTIVESLQKNPINAYRGLQTPIEKEVTHTRPECIRCASLRVRTLSHTREVLEATKLIKKAKAFEKANSKEIYKKAFVPKVRPFLSESRMVLGLPEDATPLCQEYMVCGARARLYRVKSWDEDLYYIVPPEYELGKKPRLLEVLMQARDWLYANASEEISSTDNSRSAKNKFETLCKIKLLELVERNRIPIANSEIETLVSILTRCTRGLDVIELLLLDPNINDVYVNSPMETTPVYVKHKDYDDCRTNIYLTQDRGDNFVLKFVLKSGIGLSPNSPILDMELEELKTRVSVISPPLSPDGLAFSLRCRNETPWTLPMLIEKKMIDPLGAGLLTTMVNDQVAVLIVGGRGTGKSSFLGAVMAAMNPKYRILTIEDTLELPVAELNDVGFRVQRMLAKPVTTSEGINITADDALRSSLRMGESSIVVGEVRGQEARVLYESIRVGATGNTVLGTIHGRSPQDVFERVVYDLKIPATSFKATDVIIVTERLPSGRKVTEIAELNKDLDIEGIGSGAEAKKLFTALMRYYPEKGLIALCEGFSPERSHVIKVIARRRGVTPRHVWREIDARARAYEEVLAWHRKSGDQRILEAKSCVDLGKKFTSLVDEERSLNGNEYAGVDYEKVLDAWRAWAEKKVNDADEKRTCLLPEGMP